VERELLTQCRNSFREERRFEQRIFEGGDVGGVERASQVGPGLAVQDQRNTVKLFWKRTRGAGVYFAFHGVEFESYKRQFAFHKTKGYRHRRSFAFKEPIVVIPQVPGLCSGYTFQYSLEAQVKQQRAQRIALLNPGRTGENVHWGYYV
jgi:hypothetical protein